MACASNSSRLFLLPSASPVHAAPLQLQWAGTSALPLVLTAGQVTQVSLAALLSPGMLLLLLLLLRVGVEAACPVSAGGNRHDRTPSAASWCSADPAAVCCRRWLPPLDVVLGGTGGCWQGAAAAAALLLLVAVLGVETLAAALSWSLFIW
jgi:hypothetical protein